MTTKEKRKHIRFDSLNLLNYICYNKSGQASLQGMGRTLNVSEAGVELETYVSLESYSDVSLAIGFGDDLVNIKGRTTHSRPVGNKRYDTGIEFIEVAPEDRAIIKRYIDLFKSQKDRRHFERFDTLNLLHYVCLDQDYKPAMTGMGRTLNVGQNGILMETVATLEPFEYINIIIGFCDDLVQIRGKIVHVLAGDLNRFETGIRFLEIEDNAFAILKRFIQVFESIKLGHK